MFVGTFVKIMSATLLAAVCCGLLPGAEKEDGHKAYHHGCLNALGTCENGHAEVRIDGDTLKLWFVGGGTDTNKAVRITNKEIVLEVTLNGQKAPSEKLVLKAVPNSLAEEKVGDCSQFEGKAGWLRHAKRFFAISTITLKSKKQTLRIEYPDGYDPD